MTSRSTSVTVSLALCASACGAVVDVSSTTAGGADDSGSEACGHLAYAGDCFTCAKSNCDAEVAACLGDDWTTAPAGAPCSAYVQCLCSCPANTDCHCINQVDEACLECIDTKADACTHAQCQAECY